MAWVGKDGAVYTNYAEMRKNDARYELLDKQNKLLEEQNKLLRGVDNYTQPTTYYNYQKNEDLSNEGEDLSNENKPVILPLLSFASIIPIIIGIALIITRVGGADATLRGIRFITGGLVFPNMYWVQSKRSIISIYVMTITIIGFIFTLMIK